MDKLLNTIIGCCLPLEKLCDGKTEDGILDGSRKFCRAYGKRARETKEFEQGVGAADCSVGIWLQCTLNRKEW